jgi:hypothetical protein
MTYLIELTRSLREEASKQAARTPAWRKQDWLQWRDEYLGRRRPQERQAWIGISRGRCRLATLEDLWLGGLQVRTSQPVEAGTVLRVELMEAGALACEPLMVRVMQVIRQGRDWLVNCCFSGRRELNVA